MATARMKAARTLVLSQAAVLFASMSGPDIIEFIRCGDLGFLGSREDVMPYDQASLKQLVNTGRMG